MKKTTALVLVSFFLFTSYRPHTPSISKHFTIQAIAPGVWAAINNDEYGHAICNAGIIDLGDKTVIFDSFMNIDAAMDLKSAAIALTNKTATIIINSHFHNDHIRGNQVFVPEATIISTIWTRQQISISEPEEISWEKQNAANRLADAKEKFKIADGMAKKELPMWIGYFEGMVLSDPILITTLPDLTFSDSLWIHGKNRNIQLLECKNGHTGSDIILELPVEGIVFMGDLLFVNRHPWLGDGNYKSWLTHLQKMGLGDELSFVEPEKQTETKPLVKAETVTEQPVVIAKPAEKIKPVKEKATETKPLVKTETVTEQPVVKVKPIETEKPVKEKATKTIPLVKAEKVTEQPVVKIKPIEKVEPVKEKATAVTAAVIKKEPEKAIVLTQAAVDINNRVIETIQSVNYASDSLVLTLYDNGEVDGDTVSVLMNGEVIMPMVGLSTNAVRKTIYTRDITDSIKIVMYAETLGSLPPNTGLLIVNDGKDRYEIRFSGDLKKNAAIVFKKRAADLK